MKTCTKCKISKELTQFNKRAKAADGLTHYCKPCLAEGNRKWQAENKDRMADYRRSYNVENADKIKAYRGRYEAENKEKVRKAKADKYLRTRERCLAKVKENSAKRKPEILAYSAAYREANREKLRANQREYMKLNKEERAAYMLRYAVERRKTDPLFNLKGRLRSRIGGFLSKKGFGKTKKTYELIGCSYEHLVQHLENQFLPGMTWENRSTWHVDHRIPLASAKNEEEIYKLFHYTNLQPLWAAQNISKGARMPEEAA